MQELKKSYLGVEIKILNFDLKDIISTSGGWEGPYEDPDESLPSDGWT